MSRTTHALLFALALAAASAMLLAPGTGSGAIPMVKSPLPAASPGAVKWRFQVSGSYVLHRPAVGPDGGVVVAGSTGNVYSLTADGALRWVVPAGADGLSIGPDGTVYAGSMSTITAIAPNGSIRWTYTEPSVGQGLIAGPTVGPDGNIYAISDYGGLGAFALSPEGQPSLEQSREPDLCRERPARRRDRLRSGPALWGIRRAYGVARARCSASPWEARSSGRAPLGGSDDPFMQQQRQPATGVGRQPLPDRDGRRQRLGPAPRRSGQRERSLELLTVAVERDVGSERGAGRLGLLLAEPLLSRVGDAGRAVTLDVLRRLDHRSPAVSPDGSIVVAGDRPNFGEPGSVRGWNASNGALSWQVEPSQ